MYFITNKATPKNFKGYIQTEKKIKERIIYKF